MAGRSGTRARIVEHLSVAELEERYRAVRDARDARHGSDPPHGADAGFVGCLAGDELWSGGVLTNDCHRERHADGAAAPARLA
jgi:hypothetical protein